MSKTFEERVEQLARLETAVAMALIFEWVKTDVINKAEFNGLVRRVLNRLEPVAYGSGDGSWIRAEDKPLRPDQKRFNIEFYGE